MAKVTVLGAGGTGCYIAADLAMKNVDVALYEEKIYWADQIEGIFRRGGIEMTGRGAVGYARIPLITDNLEEAVRNAELIIVSMVAWRHKKMAELLKPYVRDDMTIVFSAGNFGSITFRNIFGSECKAAIGETQGNMFSCRMDGDGIAFSAGGYVPKWVAAFPARDTKRLMECFLKYYDCIEAKNVFETALNAPNVVIHLAGSVLNAGAIDRNCEFALYQEGISESVLNCQKTVEAEKEKIMTAMNYRMVIHTDHMERVMQYDKFPELDAFRSLKGPSSMHHRYVVEDATTGESILMQLGELLGIELPTIHALVQVAGSINGENYFERGLTLADLGVTGTTAEEINEYLYAGI